jgi:signal transduction histidine kinase
MEERIVQDLAGLRTKKLIQLEGQSDAAEWAPAAAWRVRFELLSNPAEGFEIEVSEETIIGIMDGGKNTIDLKPYGAIDLGVSRRHLKLLPTPTELIAIDLQSTNGTYLNELLLYPKTAYRLLDGDMLSLGKLEFVLHIVIRPGESGADMRARADLAEALAEIGKAITSQLDLNLILDRALEMARTLTFAGETSIWLIDPENKDLFLVAEQGMGKGEIRHMRLPAANSLMHQVIETRKSLRLHSNGDDGMKIQTGYLVQSLLYVPLMHRGMMFGVLAASHRSKNRIFTARDERLLEALADFVAIAVQNANLYAEIQEADRLKSEMIQNISHEFRTPLTYVVGYVGMMLEEHERLAPEHKQDLEIILFQTQRLTWLIDNFLSLATAEEITEKRIPTNPRDLLQQVFSAAQLAAGERGITLQFESEASLPEVDVNPLAILQVIDNLLGNALKFTPKGGEVRLSARYDTFREKIIVSIADTGIGIPEDMRDRIFDRFYQVDGSPSRRYQGVGIGLSVCKAIIGAHGEEIWVSCPSEGGAIFTFTLPLASTIPMTPQQIAIAEMSQD